MIQRGWSGIACLLVLIMVSPLEPVLASEQNRAFRSLTFGDSPAVVRQKIADDPELRSGFEQILDQIGVSLDQLRGLLERTLGPESRPLIQQLLKTYEARYQLGEVSYRVETDYCEERLCRVRLVGPAYSSRGNGSREVLRQRDLLVNVLKHRYGPASAHQPVDLEELRPPDRQWTHIWKPRDIQVEKRIRLGISRGSDGYALLVWIESPEWLKSVRRETEQQEERLIEDAASDF